MKKIEKVETPKSLHTVKYSLFTPRKVFVTDNFNKENSISEIESNLDTDNENISFISNDEINSSYPEKYREENSNTLICTGQKEISLNNNSENKGIGKINVLKSEKISFMSQNVRSLRSAKQAINLDAIIYLMSVRSISAYCLQETWLNGDFIKEINGYTVFHHGLKEQTCSRGQKGVAIILSPELTKFYNLSGSKPPVIPKIATNEEYGRFIGLHFFSLR